MKLWSTVKHVVTWTVAYAVIGFVAMWATGSIAYAALLVGLLAVMDFWPWSS